MTPLALRYTFILLICSLPTSAFGQSGGDGFDLGAALDAKKKKTNNSRETLNNALSPFYNAELVDLKVGKPELVVEGDRVKVNYPVAAQINMGKYTGAVKELEKVLSKIGKPVEDFQVTICSTGSSIGISNQCQERRGKKKNGDPWRYYELSHKLTWRIPAKHLRFVVNFSPVASTVKAWDVPITALDMKAIGTHLGQWSNPTKVTVGLRDAKGDLVALQQVEVGIGAKRNRVITGANHKGDFVFVNPRPIFRGNFNVIWEVEPTLTIKVPFQLATETARKIKGVIVNAKPKAFYNSRTQKVR